MRAGQTALGLPDGKMIDDTESRNTYKDHMLAEKPMKSKGANDNLTPAKTDKMSNIDDTHNRQTYKQHELQKAGRIRKTTDDNIPFPKDRLPLSTQSNGSTQ